MEINLKNSMVAMVACMVMLLGAVDLMANDRPKGEKDGKGCVIKKTSKLNKKRVNTWAFIGSTLFDAANITTTNYVMNPTSLPSGCGDGDELPCYFVVPDNVNTISTLQSYLHSTFGTSAAAIRDGADEKRPE